MLLAITAITTIHAKNYFHSKAKKAAATGSIISKNNVVFYSDRFSSAGCADRFAGRGQSAYHQDFWF
jgi:hypothetical protein